MEHQGWTVAIVKRAAGKKGFVVLPRRWVVERTFGWLGRYRVLSKDDEQLPESSETLVLIVMIQIMPRRLEPGCNALHTSSWVEGGTAVRVSWSASAWLARVSSRVSAPCRLRRDHAPCATVDTTA